jgi:nicotine blue oxidoreductase
VAAIAGVLLAAGGGSRYGMPKALARVDGDLMAQRALDTLRDGGVDPVIAVIGAAADEVRTAVAWGDAIVIENPEWATGMGSSLRAGLAAIGAGVGAALILLVDTPGITAAAIRRVVDALGADDPGRALLAASYGGRQGHPVLIGREHWAGVAAAAVGDTGAKPYLAAHRARLRLIACDDIADGTDVDTPG